MLGHHRLRLSRRGALSALAACGAGTLVASPAPAARPDWPSEAPLGPASPFTFERLMRQAATLARTSYRPSEGPTAELVRQIGFDAFGQVTYRPEATLWGGEPGGIGVRMFPLGRYAPTPVAIHVVSAGLARQVLYSPALFDMPSDSPIQKLGSHAGFAGFRVMNADRRTDWVAYLGASYFRSADPFNQYGLSARGIAIDTASPAPEEFPSFTAFWLERDAETLVVHALLDGPSVTGAYRIAHARSPSGLVQDIVLQLHFRRPVERLGLAPLTSMYWYGQADRQPRDDWRPQIHDSDGLSIWTGPGERIWRPLNNPPRVVTNAFMDRSPRGFGLMQRDRNFADYQDDGAFYERRPSAWVEPVGDWGEGSVQLVEIPTSGEVNDNIVAFWTPAASPTPGQPLDLRYRLHWTGEEPTPVGVAKVVATRSGRGGRPGLESPAGRRKYVVDFAGDALAGLTRSSGVEAVVSLSQGQALDVAAYPIAEHSGWRLMFDVELAPNTTLNLRAFLRRGGQALTETWIDQAISS